MDGTVFEAENIEYPQERDMTFPRSASLLLLQSGWLKLRMGVGVW